MLAVAEAEQDPGRDAAVGELAAQDRKRRDSDTASDQDRPGGAGAKSAGLEKGGRAARWPRPARPVPRAQRRFPDRHRRRGSRA